MSVDPFQLVQTQNMAESDVLARPWQHFSLGTVV